MDDGTASVAVARFLLSLCCSFLAVTVALWAARWALAASRRRWCACQVCSAYLSSSWSEQFENLADWYTHLLRESPTATIHVHVLGSTITANPANVRHILLANFPNYPKGRAFSTILGDLLGRGIFNADGRDWQFQRKLASLELGSVSVRSFAFRVVSGEVHHRLLPLLAASAGSLVDLQDVFRRFSFDTICKFSFGIDPGCLQLSLPISRFAAAFDTASRLSAERATAAAPWTWKARRLLRLGREGELRRALLLVDELAREVIRQRRDAGAGAGGQDLLSRFMGSVDDDEYLRDIVISFLLAGRDTVAAGLTSFFFLLSRHPAVEARLLEEAASAEVASYEHLRRLEYLHAAVHESLRLYPPVQFDSKFAAAADVLPDGTRIGKNTRVTYHQYAMGRMEAIWGRDCLEFRPERWLRDGKFVPADPFRFAVFQAGPRVCLGKEMAIMEMKSVIVTVLQSFRLEVAGGSSLRFSPGLTSTVHGGLHARVCRRALDDN